VLAGTLGGLFGTAAAVTPVVIAAVLTRFGFRRWSGCRRWCCAPHRVRPRSGLDRHADRRPAAAEERLPELNQIASRSRL